MSSRLRRRGAGRRDARCHGRCVRKRHRSSLIPLSLCTLVLLYETNVQQTLLSLEREEREKEGHHAPRRYARAQACLRVLDHVSSWALHHDKGPACATARSSHSRLRTVLRIRVLLRTLPYLPAAVRLSLFERERAWEKPLSLSSALCRQCRGR